MRIFKKNVIVTIFLAVLSATGRIYGTETLEMAPEVTGSRILLVPFDNPLKDHEANTIVWSSAYDMSTLGCDWMTGGLGLNRSLPGRVVHYWLIDYFAYASKYYSHEIAHSFNLYSHRFWVDLSDWSKRVPAYVWYSFYDFFGDADRWNYFQLHPDDKEILSWFLLVEEAGLYQNKFNARYRARRSASVGSTTLSDGVFFLKNQIAEAKYIIVWGDDPYAKEQGTWEVLDDLNDVTAYIYFMDRLGSDISKDTWFAWSVASVLASGQTWNSGKAIFDYIFNGDESVRNNEFGIGNRVRVAFPNFYLFPSVRGLYLESETYFRNVLRYGDGFFLSLGSGLDTFGVEKTGTVDRLRFGGHYHSILLPYSIELQPFLHLDFTNGFKQTGYSIGTVVEAPVYKRFFVTTKIEHSRNDMIKQVIMGRDEGFRFFAAFGYRI